MSVFNTIHGNSSLVSVGSNKDKDLPPIPSKSDPHPSVHSNPVPNIHTENTETQSKVASAPIYPDDSLEILQTKTLKRKNFKKLSLQSSPSLDTNHEAELDQDPISQYKVQSLRTKRQRPPPLLTLREATTAKVANSNSLSPMTLDPASNLDLNNSHILVANQLESLDLNGSPPSINRKRQTVISSISPIRSTNLEFSNPPSPHTQFTPPNSQLASTQCKGTKKTMLQHLLSNQTLSLDDKLPQTNSSSSRLQIQNNDDLMMLKDLGSGSSGTVSKVVHLPSQTTMAKKVIPIDSNDAVQKQIIRELRILHECQSPYIIEFYGAFVHNNNIVICMEYCNCGSLDKILPLCEHKQIPTFVLKKLAFSILSGLNYLYQTHKILHRDIKPSNVLMTHKGEFRLCDFGVSRQLTNSITQADTFVGTSMYMSPERIQGLAYGIKSDVWSMGLLLIEMASGSPIWKFDENTDSEGSGSFRGPESILDLLQRIVNEEPPSLFKKLNPTTKEPYDTQLCKLISQCLEKDLSLRRSPRNLLADKTGFLKGVEDGVYDKDVKNWAKGIRKAHIAKNDK
jgi:mitogen-activated protein kinase kinase